MTGHANPAVVEALNLLLADTYTLYLKTHNYHWNVTGPMFTTLHTLFETQYTELALAVDEIAERIRSVGAFAPGSYAEYAKLTSVQEASGRTEAKEMIRHLVADQEKIAVAARRVIDAADAVQDQATTDLAIRRLQTHSKNAWMLQSHLE